MKKMPDCIIAAAGRSSRMGVWKPGLSWGDTKMALYTARQAQQAGCRVIIAGGFRFPQLMRMFKGFDGVRLLRVLRWRRGMGYTVSRALGFVESDAAFIVPVDMPNIKTEDFIRLYQEFSRLLYLDAEGFEVLRPSFGGKPGHPVLIKGNVAAELRRSKDGTAIRTLLERFQNRFIEWDHPGVVQDLDTPEEYEALKAMVYPGQ